MQQSWREDADKLTFIICRPVEEGVQSKHPGHDLHESPETMLGDVNMFVSMSEESTPEKVEVVGELELMIAENDHQRKGYGKAALLTFLMYVMHNQDGIIQQFLKGSPEPHCPTSFVYLAAKIGKDNARSLALFAGLGFKKTSEEPNYWGEYGLRHKALTVQNVEEMMQEYGVQQYTELRHGA